MPRCVFSQLKVLSSPLAGWSETMGAIIFPRNARMGVVHVLIIVAVRGSALPPASCAESIINIIERMIPALRVK